MTNKLKSKLEYNLEEAMKLEVIDPVEGIIYFKKAIVDTIKNYKIEIRVREHAPPHFHLISSDRAINAVFTIKDCSLIDGNSPSQKEMKSILYWYHQQKVKLIEFWNKTRPANCPVGEYTE